MNITRCVAASLLILSIASGCTNNQSSRRWGGTSSVDLPCGKKLFDVTWKDADLWYATRAMREGEQPEEYSFNESSNFGVFEGTVTFKESVCPPTN